MRCSRLADMSKSANLHRGHRFPVEIISRVVCLYHVFSLSLCGVELLLPSEV